MVFGRRFLVTPEMKSKGLTKGDIFLKEGLKYKITRIHPSGKTVTAKGVEDLNVPEKNVGPLRMKLRINRVMSGERLKEAMSKKDAKKIRIMLRGRVNKWKNME